MALRERKCIYEKLIIRSPMKGQFENEPPQTIIKKGYPLDLHFEIQ